jgi:transcriptional regulator with XRE-family HTH domain
LTCNSNEDVQLLQVMNGQETAPGARPASAAAHVLTRAALRAAERLGLAQKDLAVVLGVSASTVSRFPQRPLDPRSKEGELAALFVRLYRSLDALVGGQDEAARSWMHSDNTHLGSPPARLVQTVTGLVHVLEYLDAMRGKN